MQVGKEELVVDWVGMDDLLEMRHVCDGLQVDVDDVVVLVEVV